MGKERGGRDREKVKESERARESERERVEKARMARDFESPHPSHRSKHT